MIRPKKRYILFQAVSEEKLTSQEILGEILRSTKFVLGEITVAKMNLRLISFDEEIQCGIIRVSNQYSEHLRVALLLISSIGGKKAFFYTKSISGSLKKLSVKV